MEGDAVNQWIDTAELRSLAESLMVPGPGLSPAAPEAVYGDSFVGYTEISESVNRRVEPTPARDSAVRTLSEARGAAASAGIVYKKAIPAREKGVKPDAPTSVEAAPETSPVPAQQMEPQEVHLEPVASRASDAMAATEAVPREAHQQIASPFRVTNQPATRQLPQGTIVPAGPAKVSSQPEAAPMQVITSSSRPSGQPLSRRMTVFGDWLKASVPAEAFFVCDRNGEIISDEIGNEKLVKVARTLAHASSSASRQVGDAGGLGSPHVKIGQDRILQVIPKRSKFGLVVLGIIVPAPLRKDAVAAIAHSLSKTLGDEISIPAQR